MRSGKELIRELCQKAGLDEVVTREFEQVFAQLDIARSWTEATSSNPRFNQMRASHAVLGAGDVTIDEEGIKVVGNSLDWIRFFDETGTLSGKIGQLDGRLYLRSQQDGTVMYLNASTVDFYLRLLEDPAQAGRGQLDLTVADYGSKITIGGTNELQGGGGSGGYTYQQMQFNLGDPPTDLPDRTSVRWYLTTDATATKIYFVFQINHSGTYRYKYIELTGTDTTWTHSTTPP